MEPKTSAPIPFPVKYVVAPMVGQSDLSFRLLCRRHGASVAYTEMLYSELFASDPLYRAQAFQTSVADRPLVIQFAANDADVVCEAGMAIQDEVDAIDINLGCPQQRAMDRHFGAYLQDDADWPTVFHMVASLSSAVRIPVFCKIRLLSSLKKTIEFCRGLEASGCALVAVHGRKRGSPNARRSGAADLLAIKAIKEALRIPVVSNGNVGCASDVATNLEVTGADGIMSAEAVLADPLLFQGGARSREERCGVALEYLSLCAQHNTSVEVARQHLHYMLGKKGREHCISFKHYGGYSCGMDLKCALDNAQSTSDLELVVRQSLGVPNWSSQSPFCSPFSSQTSLTKIST